MYQILIDGGDLYYPGDEEYTVSDAVVNLQLNDSGSVEFNLPVTNPEYANIKNRISMIQVLKNGNEIFYGEVRESEKDFYGTKQVYAVGELAFLFDSIQPQAKYQDKTARQLLEAWLNIHNSQVEEKKRFYVGMVTVHDSNDSLYRFTNQETTLDCIREKLCEKLNGYLRIRKVDGRRYLDLVTLQDYGKICEQPIEFGENLLDYAENVSASDLYTSVIPKGARLEESKIEGLESYVDITSVNSGKDYLYSQETVNLYGWNRCVVSWDDVTEPANLKNKGEQWLKENKYETMVLELSAADMSLLDIDMESFELGDSVPVYSKPHGMDRTFPVQKLELHLQNPAEDKLQLGNSMKLSYTEQSKGHYQYIEQELENNRQTTSWLQSAIDNATAMMTGSKGGYKVTEFDEKGRWLRDLYMNASSKEQATQVMQINMNGIGFSRDGFDGPYKNAWTIDGVLLGEFIKAGTISAEKLSVEYRESVSDEINTATTSTLNVAKGLIEAEATRASKAEEDLRKSITQTESNLNDFKEELDTTFKDGIIEETEAEAIGKYLNVIETDYKSIMKQCDTIVNSLPTESTAERNLKITFSPDCKTETSSTGVKYDYLKIYFVKEGEIYQYSDKLSGQELAGETLIFPEAEFYLYWHSDYSNAGAAEYYGFSVEALEKVFDTPITGVQAALPKYSIIDTKSKEILSTSHPYERDEDKIWHYKESGITRIQVTDKVNVFKTAYNALKTYIHTAISDKKATETEAAEVNKRFSTYNTALSELKEILYLAQLDTALGAAGGVAEYARGNFKVTADQIKAEIERATGEEEKLKSSLELQAGMIESKVEINEIGSYVQQYYNKVLIGFNNNSKYVQITAGQIAIYDCEITDSKKRTVFDENGNHFYRDGYYVGKIGTNRWGQDNSHKGLSFNMEYEGKYMSWSQKKSADANAYTTIWTYSRANSIYRYQGLHAGADIYMNAYDIYFSEDQRNLIMGYTGGIGIRGNQSIYFEIGDSQTRAKVDSSALHIYNGLTAYNNTALDFYSDLDMHNYSIYNNSDARLKENIQASQGSALEKIQQLDVLQYDWRESKKHVNMGVIAQQVQEIIPEAVKVSDKTGLYSVNQLAFIPYLIKAVQELSGRPVSVSAYAAQMYTPKEIECAMEAARPPVPELEKEKPEPLVVKMYDTDKEVKDEPEQK